TFYSYSQLKVRKDKRDRHEDGAEIPRGEKKAVFRLCGKHQYSITIKWERILKICVEKARIRRRPHHPQRRDVLQYVSRSPYNEARNGGVLGMRAGS
ncbi:MAG: hypothetical protein ACXAEN_17155, partial [Candidatus Thorarchaeota archaeon]